MRIIISTVNNFNSYWPSASVDRGMQGGEGRVKRTKKEDKIR